MISSQGSAAGARRRTVLRAAAAAAVSTLGTQGCSSSGGATQAAVIWSGGELAEFRAVLGGYGGSVHVISAGDDIDAFLRARHRAGTSPDVAVLSRPGLVIDYADAGWLAPLSEDFAKPFSSAWSDLLRVNGTLYGAWVKAAFKSLLWYRPSIVESPPLEWHGFVDLVRHMGAQPGPRPLAIGAADGWVLTDWFEEVLAAIAPACFYDSLARGEPRWNSSYVRRSLEMLAEVWAIPGAFVGGPQRALVTQFDESVVQVASQQAAMLVGADFVEGIAENFAEPGAMQTVRFPTVCGVRPLVFGGDAAVVLRGSDNGMSLLSYLIEGQRFKPWIRAGGYLTPNLGVTPDQYPDALSKHSATEIRNSSVLRFDLSDRLTGAFGGADGVGIWQILQEFFRAVTARGARPADVIDSTIGQLDRAARQNGGAS